MSYHPYANANPYGAKAQAAAAASSSSYQAQAGPSYAGPSYPVAGPSYPAEYAAGDRTQMEANYASQSSIYTPDAVKKSAYRVPGKKGEGRHTVLRKGGGKVWEDQSLLQFNQSNWRLFVGDLDPALSDDVFKDTFSKYPSFEVARIVRDKLTNKAKYGFVEYSDPESFLKAWKELNGKYIGTRPCKISKATAQVGAVDIGAKKAKHFDDQRKAKTGTVAFSRAKLAEAEGGGLNRVGPERTKKSYIRR
ncbi:RNA-binding domain-containing protein [Meredithblackwellia eburnea MCA 4105]